MPTVQSLVWLALGGLFRLFSFGKWTIPVADWLVPLLLLHFIRGVEPLAGALGIWLVFWVAVSIANRGVLQVPGVAYFGVTALLAASVTLPYLADRLLVPQLPGFAATLVFPCAWVTMELIVSRTNPFGTWGAVAYSQYGNQPLMQLASVAGLGGVAFIVSWFGPVANWAWAAHFDWAIVGTGVLLYAGVWALVMLGGGARLAFAPSNGKTTRVAVIGWPDGVISEPAILRIFEPQLPAGELEKILHAFDRLKDWFLDNAQREAHAGARMVVWPENNVMVLEKDEAAFLQRASEVARQEQVYLLMGILSFRLGKSPPVENKAVFVDPSGEVVFTYFKTRLVPGFEASVTRAGDGRIPTTDTPYGRIASAICYDMDFPNHIRQVGRAGADVLIVPASEPGQTGPMHFRMAVFRAIENGISMVRAARWGFSAAVDPYGRTMAIMDESAAEQRVLVSQVPIRGVRTIYARIGDLFAWLCAAGLLAAAAWAIL